MTSGHADGHRIKIVPWFSLTLDSCSQETSLQHVQNMSQNPLEMLEFWRIGDPIPCQTSSWWFFRSFRLRNKSAVPMLNLGFYSSLTRRCHGEPQGNAKMALGNGCPHVSGLLTLIISYIDMFMCFFAKLFYKRCWPILLFWGRGIWMFLCINDIPIPTAVVARHLLGDSISSGIIWFC